MRSISFLTCRLSSQQRFRAAALSAAIRLRSTDSTRGTSEEAKRAAARRQGKEFISNIGSGATSMPQVGTPSEGSRGIFGWFGRSARKQPLNPLRVLKQRDTNDKSTKQVMAGLKKMGGNVENITITEDQQIDIVNETFKDRWWGKAVMRAIRYMPPSLIKKRLKVLRWVIILMFLCLLGTAAGAFIYELILYGRLEQVDRDTYRHVMTGMRKSDLMKIGYEVEAKEDPSGLLKMHELVALMLKEIRNRGLDKVDFELEYRRRGSPLEELDWIHLTYEVLMKTGAFVLMTKPYRATDSWVLYGEEKREELRRTTVGPAAPAATSSK